MQAQLYCISLAEHRTNLKFPLLCEFLAAMMSVCLCICLESFCKAYKERCFEGVARVFGNFKEVLRVVTERYKGVSRTFNGSFKEVSRVFQGYFKKILRVFQEKLKGVLRNSTGISEKFQMCFKDVSRVFQDSF